MAVTFKVDMRQFNAVLKVAVRESSRAAQDVINNHAYAVAVGAAHATKIGDKEKIRYVLGEAHGPAAPTKSGKMPKAKWRQLVYRDDSFAARIINAARVKAGKKPLFGAKLDQRIRKMIIGRAASVGFIASGFVRAARQLRRFAKKLRLKETPKGIKIVPGGASGKGVPAKSGGGLFGSGQFTARVENDVVLSGGRWQAEGRSFNPGPMAEAALRIAMANEQASMLQKMKITFEEAMRRSGAL